MKAPLVECEWMSVVIERIKATRCICFAVSGSSSLTCRPGTLVGIEPIVPRISAGASGFGSKVSCCGGPPLRKSSTQDLARPKDEPFTWPRPGSARSKEGSPRPSAPRPPARSHSRRVGAEAGEGFMGSRSSRGETRESLPESGDPWRWRICGWGRTVDPRVPMWRIVTPFSNQSFIARVRYRQSLTDGSDLVTVLS